MQLRQAVTVQPGQNVIEVVAYDKLNHVFSEPATLHVNSTTQPSSQSPRLFVLSIGINNYWDSRLRLNFAATDASDVANGFQAGAKDLFDKTEIDVLLDEKATKAGLDGVRQDRKRNRRHRRIRVVRRRPWKDRRGPLLFHS
ncbi:hypothetical protein MOV76_06970 [Rhizobium sp. PRIMUS64]|uniref:hypothetical protein n=1 Tax=Rhizobium sp. PRIMUS64 TaxID=2908925 RepID=UPI001FF16973|nr:hypothetical protein [Rhizobium sp. PRIMUS64]MCJ9691374.1 hypothetical protein [Rhizobium sp. PRIMUS64]